MPTWTLETEQAKAVRWRRDHDARWQREMGGIENNDPLNPSNRTVCWRERDGGGREAITCSLTDGQL
jgi:hypothetical protein